MIDEPVYVFEGRVKNLLLAVFIYVLASILAIAVFYYKLPFTVPSVYHGGFGYPLLFCLFVALFLSYLGLFKSKKVVFFENHLKARSVLGRSFEIPYSELDFKPPLERKTGGYTNFGVRRMGESSSWIDVG